MYVHIGIHENVAQREWGNWEGWGQGHIRNELEISPNSVGRHVRLNHHWLHGCESEQTTGDGDGQGLVCRCPWGCKESDTTELQILTEEAEVSDSCISAEPNPSFRALECHRY